MKQHRYFRIQSGPPALRSGYTMIELLAATLSASILLAGLSSSLFIATQAFDDSDSQPTAVLKSNLVANQILSQMQYATRFYEKTANAVTFAVPDRDGDGSEELFSYTWSGIVDDPLMMSYNNSFPAVLLPQVKSLDFIYLTKEFDVVEVSAGEQVQYEGMSEVLLDPKDDEVTLTLPTGTSEGDLVIAALAIRKGKKSTLATATAGWNAIAVEEYDSTVTLGVWWKIVGAGEPSPEFAWTGTETAYGWTMRFTNHHPTTPINDWAIQTTPANQTLTPTSPAIAPNAFNSLVLRLGAFEMEDITVGQPGLQNHTSITMNSSKNISGGAGYRQWTAQGNTGSSSFELLAKNTALCLTVGISPDPGS